MSASANHSGADAVAGLPVPDLLGLEAACRRRSAERAVGRKVVLTNGCFDLLHAGHLSFLKAAAALGDHLIVALNSDASVRALKGDQRPVMSARERAYALSALGFVDTLIVFDTPRLTAEISALQPDVYAKAGDYTLETLNAEERAALEAAGAEIRFLPFLPGYSTTGLIQRISSAADSF